MKMGDNGDNFDENWEALEKYNKRLFNHKEHKGFTKRNTK